MKMSIYTLLILFFALSLAAVKKAKSQKDMLNFEKKAIVREKLLLDLNWKFHLGNAADIKSDFDYGLGSIFAKAGESIGAVQPDFDDSEWRILDLPHDWAVELDFVNVSDEDVKSHGYKPIGRQFPQTTIGWYRKTFYISKSDEDKKFAVKFDGVFRDCTIWLNGHYIGRNLSGYSEFSFDVTDYLYFGRKNVLVVRVDASQYEGWFYEGAGIYRHTWLLKYDRVNIPEYGIFVHSEISDNIAKVNIETRIINQSDNPIDCKIVSVIFDEQGKKIKDTTSQSLKIDPNETKTFEQQIILKNPQLWSLEEPNLYKLVSIVKSKNNVFDSVETTFGIRTILWDKDKGFFLNGKYVKIKGVCCHQDHSGVGSALPDRLQYYRIERLKEMGCNAYRTSHNPPTNELLNACDKLGMLVMDENRLIGSTPEYIGQFEKLILRDRNHPSVILWSIGNEEYSIQNSDIGKKLASSLIKRQKELDPTRLCTYAANNGNQFEGINSVLPMRGFNYMNVSDIDKYRNDHPEQILIGSEEASTLCTRGIYSNDTINGFVCDYDINIPGWGCTAEKWWKFFDERPWLMGAFVWTGFDYRGEPTPYSWPCINSHFGIMDVCGFPKNNYYYYQAWWSNKDVMSIYPHWNWKGKEGDTIDVWCQTNCEGVELILNGKSLGRKNVMKNSHLEWKVPYQPGVLEVHGWTDTKLLTRKIVTTGNPVRIILKPDRSSILADGEDVSVINITVVDENGWEVPTADNLIKFEISGNGKIIGVGNGNPSSHEPDKYLTGNYQRKLFNGKCQVIIQSKREPGDIILIASSDGLNTEKISMKALPSELKPTALSENPDIIKHKAFKAKVDYKNPYSTKYPGIGSNTLVDGEIGSTDFRDGFWQGFEENNLEIIIDLDEILEIKKITSNYLQNINSWIFLPEEVKYYTSKDGIKFELVEKIKNTIPDDKGEKFIKTFSAKFKTSEARYIKVQAKNIGLCPKWHVGAGKKAWLFVDEIVVE